MIIVRKEQIPPMDLIEKEGGKEFYRAIYPWHLNSNLAQFLKDNNAQMSMTYTQLEPNETHNAHTHSKSSLVMIISGRATVLGVDNTIVEKGDIVCIPSNALHGFTCNLGYPLETVSIQFDNNGIFNGAPDIIYSENSENNMKSAHQQLIELNETLCKKIESSPFFLLYKNKQMTLGKNLAIFKGYLRQWSEAFQYVMYARQTTTTDKKFHKLFLEHFKEELGHDELLPEKRKYDAKLAAYGSWFILKMLQSDNIDKLVIVHMVLEKCADAFHAIAVANINEPSIYLETHAELDEGHSKLGQDLLENISMEECSRLTDVCIQSWEMMRLILDRIADLTINDSEFTKTP